MFSLLCTFKEAIRNLEANVDVQMGPLGLLNIKLTIYVIVSSNSCFHLLLSYGDSP
jgi:hypothetical protein